MPIFDFKCEKCDHKYEQMIYRTDQTPKCPECEAEDDQTKHISFDGFIRTQNPDAPKNDYELSRYLGNGKYMPKNLYR
jgi:putative FmdB family regulatory protein